MDGQTFHAQLHVVIDDGSQNRLLHQQLSGLGLYAYLLPESADRQEPCGNSPACGTTRVLAGNRPAAQTQGFAGNPNTGTDQQSDQSEFSRERTGMILDTNIHPSQGSTSDAWAPLPRDFSTGWNHCGFLHDAPSTWRFSREVMY